MKVLLNKIESNPYRDEFLDPVDKEKVKELVESIKGAGKFLGSLPARKVGNKYQIVYGHNRLAALRILELEYKDVKKYKSVEIDEVDYDDAKMVQVMSAENATQRGVEGGAATDAVAAAIRIIGYELMTDEKGGENLPHLFDRQSSFTQAKTKFLSGEGIGKRVIGEFLKESPWKEQQIRDALANLKASAYMETLSEKIGEQIDRSKMKQAEKEAAKKKAITSSNNAPERIFDLGVEHILDRDSHTTAFRKTVTGKTAQIYIPVEKQAALAEGIIEYAKKEKKPVSAKMVVSCINNEVKKALDADKKAQEKHGKELLNEQAREAWKSLKAAIRKATKESYKVVKCLSDGSEFPEDEILMSDFIQAEIPQLEKSIRAMDSMLISEDDIVAIQ